MHCRTFYSFVVSLTELFFSYFQTLNNASAFILFNPIITLSFHTRGHGLPGKLIKAHFEKTERMFSELRDETRLMSSL